MLNNPILSEGIWAVRAAYKRSKAPIWLKLRKLLESSGPKHEVDLAKLSKLTEHGDIVIVPGKVLGMGNMDHNITLCAFSLSENAARKIVDADGKIFSVKEFVEEYPEGRKVKIIG